MFKKRRNKSSPETRAGMVTLNSSLRVTSTANDEFDASNDILSRSFSGSGKDIGSRHNSSRGGGSADVAKSERRKSSDGTYLAATLEAVRTNARNKSAAAAEKRAKEVAAAPAAPCSPRLDELIDRWLDQAEQAKKPPPGQLSNYAQELICNLNKLRNEENAEQVDRIVARASREEFTDYLNEVGIDTNECLGETLNKAGLLANYYKVVEHHCID
jgi:hypothetical protein